MIFHLSERRAGGKQQPDDRRAKVRPLQRRLLWLIQGLVYAGMAAIPLCGMAHPAWGQPITEARITQILEGHQVFIQNQPARVNGRAGRGEQIKTGQARAELRFNTRAIGRMNYRSLLTVGGRCNQLRQGSVLVGGAASTCASSVVLGIRGTVYILAVDDQGTTELTVLEGQVDLTTVDPSLTSQATLNQRLRMQTKQDSSPCQLKTTQQGTKQGTKEISCVPVGEGLRVVVSASGELLGVYPLTPSDFLAILQGPFFQGYDEPLPQQDALRRSFERLYPNVPFPSLTIVEASFLRDALRIGSRSQDIDANNTATNLINPTVIPGVFTFVSNTNGIVQGTFVPTDPGIPASNITVDTNTQTGTFNSIPGTATGGQSGNAVQGNIFLGNGVVGRVDIFGVGNINNVNVGDSFLGTQSFGLVPDR